MQKRTLIRIKGVVQGVGFRPFVYNLAAKYNLNGFCLNSSEGVVIDVEGEGIEDFIESIKTTHPPLARIEELTVETLPLISYNGFAIKESSPEKGKFSLVSPDMAICGDCKKELFDPKDRRYGYPFINCTNCGPRYSIILDIPYDRKNTTMRRFRMCKLCSEEYDNPGNRRFHAQPNACWECGPGVWITGEKWERATKSITGSIEEELIRERVWGRGYKGAEAIGRAKTLLKDGAIIAIKGLGGFHIACDAKQDEVVKRLRDRKRKSNKPFALMAGRVEDIMEFACVSEADKKLLEDISRPVVLLKKKGASKISGYVAPCADTFGVMLPYTPLHYLIMDGFDALVMTSGNISEEPIVVENDEALERLSGIADYFLLHDRDIYMRVDDSIVRAGFPLRLRGTQPKDGSADIAMGSGGDFSVIRRARGFTPGVLDMGEDTGEILACGGELKNTFTLTKNRYAIMSQHIGDLTNLAAMEFFKETLKNLKNTFRASPKIIAYDMHPDYLSTSFANEYKKENSIPDANCIPVQHHHAHVVSVMAESGLRDKVIGVSFDGTGYGTDGHIWGGEFLCADRAAFERMAHLKYIPMPGGEKSIKEPWRMALSYLHAAFGKDIFKEAGFFTDRFKPSEISSLIKMIDSGFNCPLTSSMGRLFDGVGALIGLADTITFEGEGAITLEAIMGGLNSPLIKGRGTPTHPFGWVPEHGSGGCCYPFGIIEAKPFLIDTTPMIIAIVDDIKKGIDAGKISRKFHNTVVELVVNMVKIIRDSTGVGVPTRGTHAEPWVSVGRVVLSGGVFQNAFLAVNAREQLKKEGFSVHTGKSVPVNDGGISLGQAISAWERVKYNTNS